MKATVEMWERVMKKLSEEFDQIEKKGYSDEFKEVTGVKIIVSYSDGTEEEKKPDMVQCSYGFATEDGERSDGGQISFCENRVPVSLNESFKLTAVTNIKELLNPPKLIMCTFDNETEEQFEEKLRKAVKEYLGLEEMFSELLTRGILSGIDFEEEKEEV